MGRAPGSDPSSRPDIRTPEAFAALYAACRPAVIAFLLRAGCRRADSEDLAAEVFSRAWAGRGAFGANASAKTWILSIARNVAVDDRRGRGHEPSQLDVDLGAGDAVAHEVAARDWAASVRQAVCRLPRKQQEAVRLVYFAGLSPREAAAEARCSAKVLRQRLADARASLRHILGE